MNFLRRILNAPPGGRLLARKTADAHTQLILQYRDGEDIILATNPDPEHSEEQA